MFRLRCALAMVVAGCVLVGCSDDEPEPKVSEPTASGGSSSAVVSPSPTTPSESRDPETTVRSWVDDWNLALRSGDTSALRAYESEPCRGCDELVGHIEDIGAAGGSFVGGSWKIAGLSAVSETKQKAEVGLAVEVSEGSTVPSEGADPTAYPPTKHVLRFELVNDAQQWKVSVIEVLS